MIAIIKAVLIGFLGEYNSFVKSKQIINFYPFDALGYVIIAWFVDPVTLPENNNLIKTEGINKSINNYVVSTMYICYLFKPF